MVSIATLLKKIRSAFNFCFLIGKRLLENFKQIKKNYFTLYILFQRYNTNNDLLFSILS